MLTDNQPFISQQIYNPKDYTCEDLPFTLPHASISIRHAEPNDCETLHQLFTDPEIANWTLGTPFVSVETIYQAIMPSVEGHYMIVATDTVNEVVGAIGLDCFSAPRMRHVAKVGPLAVHPAMKGKGVGSKLMKAIIDFADNWLNIRRLELLVYADNAPAIALYKKFGFTIEGTLRDCSFKSGCYIDAHIVARLCQ